MKKDGAGGKRLLRRDMARLVAKSTGVEIGVADSVIAAFLAETVNVTMAGGRVYLRGWGELGRTWLRPKANIHGLDNSKRDLPGRYAPAVRFSKALRHRFRLACADVPPPTESAAE